MIKFQTSPTGVTFAYKAEMYGSGWVGREHEKRSGARASNTFKFLRADLIAEPAYGDQATIDDFALPGEKCGRLDLKSAPEALSPDRRGRAQPAEPRASPKAGNHSITDSWTMAEREGFELSPKRLENPPF